MFRERPDGEPAAVKNTRICNSKYDPCRASDLQESGKVPHPRSTHRQIFSGSFDYLIKAPLVDFAVDAVNGITALAECLAGYYI